MSPTSATSREQVSARKIAQLMAAADVEVLRRQLHLLKKNRGYLSFAVPDGALFVHTFEEMFRMALEIGSHNTLTIWLLRCSKPEEQWPAFADIVKMIRFLHHQLDLMEEPAEDDSVERYMIDFDEALQIVQYLTAVIQDFGQGRPPSPMPQGLATRFPAVRRRAST
ncbi:uncharacterized protein PHACADRAFT_259369 [Phanerochaete carnosa HHB-10118-sp]|uniref:Uncharacterized protein n=1 Tax=Phanerochaete carnosa (strain HHB-10118-sp) TaxID=650164 RepID=K5UTB1_PHACS|nr:uncharacterized protein PHACADRAFT_259369 [Phanerochaete carnosa HHB-10118-sp]EKM53191.1 hypothetical protein PHACADRAFT_259369 [Phanerochaete carnosa HHB-10118-sp]